MKKEIMNQDDLIEELIKVYTKARGSGLTWEAIAEAGPIAEKRMDQEGY